MDTALLALKLAGTALAALFAALGVIHPFRDVSGRLTKWGKLSIVGTALSAFMAIASQFVDERLHQESARGAAEAALAIAKRLERVTYEISRSVQSIDSLSVGLINVNIPMNDPALAPYKDRLDDGIQAYLRKTEAQRVLEKGISSPVARIGSKGFIPTEVAIEPRHALFPHDQDHCTATALSVNGVALTFYKAPIDPRSFDAWVQMEQPQPDLSIDFLELMKPMQIVSDLDERAYFLSGSFFSASRLAWRDNSGKISSIPDLAGTQLFISLHFLDPGLNLQLPPPIRHALGEDCPKEFRLLRTKFDIARLGLRFGTREKWLQPDQLVRHIDPLGNPFWEFRFPTPPL